MHEHSFAKKLLTRKVVRAILRSQTRNLVRVNTIAHETVCVNPESEQMYGKQAVLPTGGVICKTLATKKSMSQLMSMSM